jgi:hypothetical protein
MGKYVGWCQPSKNESINKKIGQVGADFDAGALESDMHWMVIWPRAVAKAWADEKFKKKLLANAHDAIKQEFGYELSAQLDLSIEEAPAGVGAYKARSKTDPWAGLPKLKLTMTLPPAPVAEQQAVAITVYQDTGRTYPFTCC